MNMPDIPVPLSLTPAQTRREFFNLLDHRSVDGVTEVSAFDVPGCGRVATGYFDDAHPVEQQIILGETENVGNYYVTVNPVKQALLARGENKLVEWSRIRTSATDVLSVTWIFVDIDPDRPPGICATDDEKAAAWTLARAVIDVLDSAVPDVSPVVADSGNGYYILLAIAAREPSASTTAKISEIYNLLESEALARMESPASGSPTASIDRTTADPPRLCRFIGTMNRKGDDVPKVGRPWRRSQLIHVPQVIAEIDLDDLLVALRKSCGDAPAAKTESQPSPLAIATSDEPKNLQRVRAWLSRVGIAFREKEKTGE
jgi:hypothetical protein